jgi:hypothetical protein
MFKGLYQTGFKTLTCVQDFNFATKSLKIIKTRMKAVLSIKKITKVRVGLKSGYEDGRRS